MSTNRDNFEPMEDRSTAKLDAETMLAIKQLIADPIERSNRESNDAMRAMLADHVIDHDAKLKAHDARIQWLEKNVGRALAAWSFLMIAGTLAGKYLWEEWIKPVVFKVQK